MTIDQLSELLAGSGVLIKRAKDWDRCGERVSVLVGDHEVCLCKGREEAQMIASALIAIKRMAKMQVDLRT